MDIIKEIIIDYVIRSRQWPLLILLIIFIHFSIVKKLSNKELVLYKKVIKNKFFWIPSSALIILTGVLYWVFFLKTPTMPEGKLVVAIAKFTPISSGAEEEANNLSHRIEQELHDKQLKGAPIEIKRLSIQVEGTDEQTRQEVAMSLGISRKGGSHVVLWGDVRKDEGELYVEPHLTIARQLQKVPIEERKLKKYTSYEPEHINFKKRLSNEIADVVILVYGLAYYNAMDWDKAIQILDHVQSKEGYSYKGLCLDERAQQAGNPQQDLQAAIETYEKIIGSGPWDLSAQSDTLTWSAYLNRAGAIATLALTAQPKDALTYLRQAVKAFEDALQFHPRTELPLYWAIQSNLVNALCELSMRVGLEESNNLLLRAVEVNLDSLQDYTRSELPQQWAMTQNLLGYALYELGIRVGGAEGNKLLREAIKTYEPAFQVYTQTKMPKEWAETQNNLGNALCELGIQLGSNEGIRYLKDALASFNNALTVFDEKNYPEHYKGILDNKLKAIQLIESFSKSKP